MASVLPSGCSPAVAVVTEETFIALGIPLPELSPDPDDPTYGKLHYQTPPIDELGLRDRLAENTKVMRQFHRPPKKK